MTRTLNASFSRAIGFLIAFALVAALLPNSALAQTQKYALGGNARAQIGDGLPIPIGFAAVPTGKILPNGNPPVLTQTTGVDPKKVVRGPAPNFTYQAVPQNLPVFANNMAVFQVFTSLTISGPGPQSLVVLTGGSPGFKNVTDLGSFSANGRTGAATVSFCPGQDVTSAGNPGCASPGAGPPTSAPGRLKYTATGNQFGGPSAANVFGFANVFLKGGAAAPCSYSGGVDPTCKGVLALVSPQPTGANGAPFGFFTSTNPTAGQFPVPGNFYVTVTAGGLVQAITATPASNPGVALSVLSYGGPYTTGRLTVSVTAAIGPQEIFILSGSDGRSNGVGSLSLVAGAISNRVLSGPNANRGWLNIQSSDIKTTPSMSPRGLAAVAGLIVLSGLFGLRRFARR